MFAPFLSLALLAAPSPAATIRAADRQEAMNDALELTFDALCGELKSGKRRHAPALAEAAVQFPVDDLVQVVNCSLRALAIRAPQAGSWPVRLLWDLDGRARDGAYVTVRGEGEGAVAVAQQGKAWRLLRLDTTEGRRRLVRGSRRFVERAAEAGLTVPWRPEFTLPAEFLSGGLSVRDLDGDGLPEVLVLDGPRAQLYRALPGLRFSPPELLARAGTEKSFSSAAFGDFDADGDADLVLTTYRGVPARVFRNDGGRLTEAGRFGRGGHHQSAIPSDLNGDGHLDVAIVAYPLEGRVPSSYVAADNGEPPELWLGDGKLGFTPWPLPRSVARRHWSFAGVSADLVGDGRPQLYVVNDYGVKDLYRLLGDGGVEERAADYGLTDPGPGMSVDVGDVNGDGRLDVYVANMFSKAGTRIVEGAQLEPRVRELLAKFVRGNTLFVGQPDGGYLDQGGELGVHRALWSFGSLLSDVDDDGKLDVLVANGFVSAPIRKDL